MKARFADRDRERKRCQFFLWTATVNGVGPGGQSRPSPIFGSRRMPRSLNLAAAILRYPVFPGACLDFIQKGNDVSEPDGAQGSKPDVPVASPGPEKFRCVRIRNANGDGMSAIS